MSSFGIPSSGWEGSSQHPPVYYAPLPFPPQWPVHSGHWSPYPPPGSHPHVTAHPHLAATGALPAHHAALAPHPSFGFPSMESYSLHQPRPIIHSSPHPGSNLAPPSNGFTSHSYASPSPSSNPNPNSTSSSISSSSCISTTTLPSNVSTQTSTIPNHTTSPSASNDVSNNHHNNNLNRMDSSPTSPKSTPPTSPRFSSTPPVTPPHPHHHGMIDGGDLSPSRMFENSEIEGEENRFFLQSPIQRFFDKTIAPSSLRARSASLLSQSDENLFGIEHYLPSALVNDSEEETGPSNDDFSLSTITSHFLNLSIPDARSLWDPIGSPLRESFQLKRSSSPTSLLALATPPSPSPSPPPPPSSSLSSLSSTSKMTTSPRLPNPGNHPNININITNVSSNCTTTATSNATPVTTTTTTNIIPSSSSPPLSPSSSSSSLTTTTTTSSSSSSSPPMTSKKNSPRSNNHSNNNDHSSSSSSSTSPSPRNWNENSNDSLVPQRGLTPSDPSTSPQKPVPTLVLSDKDSSSSRRAKKGSKNGKLAKTAKSAESLHPPPTDEDCKIDLSALRNRSQSEELRSPRRRNSPRKSPRSPRSRFDFPLSSDTRIASLETCIGQITLLCKDQHGCRFLQKKLDEKDPATATLIFNEVYERIVELMTDPFGNYLCQKLLEHCNESQCLSIIELVSNHIVEISKNMHGTRAIQKMIEFLSTEAQINLVVRSLAPNVVHLIKDLNGNHVIQRCLHRLSSKENQFLYDAVSENCVEVATHRHGCCVLQRCLDHASDEQKHRLITEIARHGYTLVRDPYGNYVVQYVLDMKGIAEVKIALTSAFRTHMAELSSQKFSSNVIEKCLNVCPAEVRFWMVDELMDSDTLHHLLRDPFGNYVIQTALNISEEDQHRRLVEAIRPHLPALRNTPYGKRFQNKILRDGQKS